LTGIHRRAANELDPRPIHSTGGARVKPTKNVRMRPSKEIFGCEVCGNNSLSQVLNLGSHPLCDDLVPVGDSRVCKEYPIDILYCTRCATAHQRFQVPKEDLFPKTYHYRSRFTADVLNGMSALVDSTEERYGGLQDKLVLDVGCNDGSLLNYFQAKGARTIGIEPTDAYLDALNRGHRIYNTFFSPDSAREIFSKHGSPDVIAFTNVFAHIEDLSAVVDALKELMSERTMIVIENHYLGAVLDRFQFDTFYHEHPRTYSASSFVKIAESLGTSLSGLEFPARYGGNIRVFLGGPASSEEKSRTVHAIVAKESQNLQRFERLREVVTAWKSSMGANIADMVKDVGPLPAKAFPGRAAILVKLLGVDTASVSDVFEKPGSMKLGHYLPGTRIPIRSDLELLAENPLPPILLNLAWHISTEINAYMRKEGYGGKIVDIFNPQSFSGEA
jgi:SAM-dependent methyltransferase